MSEFSKLNLSLLMATLKTLVDDEIANKKETLLALGLDEGWLTGIGE